jgi:hypothetical protein
MLSNRKTVSGPTAENVVGEPGAAGQRAYRRREAELERAVVEYFSGVGRAVRRQVDCGFAGVADIVTDDAIYELKDWLTRRTYYTAVGQLLGYRNYLDPFIGVGVICNGTNLTRRKLEKFERLNGVPVMVWGNPPCLPFARREARR